MKTIVEMTCTPSLTVGYDTFFCEWRHAQGYIESWMDANEEGKLEFKIHQVENIVQFLTDRNIDWENYPHD